MKKRISIYTIILVLSLNNAYAYDGDSKCESFVLDGVSHVISDTSWEVDMHGTHRAVVQVSDFSGEQAYLTVLPWRRADLEPGKKKIVVVDAQTGKIIKNVKILSLTSESGTLAFEPMSGNGIYYIYYLAHRLRRGMDDARYSVWNDFLSPQDEYDWGWRTGVSESSPKAKVLRFESLKKRDFFTLMDLTATSAEIETILAENPDKDYILFPEDRAFPIRLFHTVPARWGQNGAAKSFIGEAHRNEYYVWQIGAWAARADLHHIRLTFSDLKNGRHLIPASEITCFNQEGTNWDGREMHIDLNVKKGDIQAMYCGVQIPQDAKPGEYNGTVTFHAENCEGQEIPVTIVIDNEILKDRGESEYWRLARLRWLNSTIGRSDEPTFPFKNIKVSGQIIKATDKLLTLSDNGLPASIVINGHEILDRPMRFTVSTSAGDVVLEGSDLKVKQEANGLVSWINTHNEKGIRFNLSGRMEFDGFLHYDLKVSSSEELLINDVRLESDCTPYASEYFIGASYKGGFCPEELQWNWQGPWDSFWIGNVKAGLQIEYRGGSYHGPLLGDYKPAPPRCWANNGKGRIIISRKKGEAARICATTGTDTLSPTPRNYEFAMSITPAKPVNTKKHFSERYFFGDYIKNTIYDCDKVGKEGMNVSLTSFNPLMGDYSEDGADHRHIDYIHHEHEMGRKVKIYHTIRELSVYLDEFFPLKSLNGEIVDHGIGFGVPWLMEHLIDDYRPAWYSYIDNVPGSCCVCIEGFSRYINFYLEALRWAVETYGIDGVYLDDCAFDREVMKRIRRILDEYNPGSLIDLHSNTAYSHGPANQYCAFMPYLDRLWWGESFQYNNMTPDEWLVTCSGQTLGVMGEMLQGGGNRYLGMVYGLTARHSWMNYVDIKETNPGPVWGLWKNFGIEDSKMKGYWDEDCPISTNDSDVKATVYIKDGKILISVGNFSKEDKDVSLIIDWKHIGISKSKARLFAPAVQYFQEETTYPVEKSISIKAKEGKLLILSE